MLNKLKNVLYNVILISLIIMVSYVIYRAIFDIYQPIENLKPIVIIVGTITLIMVLITIKKLINKLNKKQIKILAIVITILFFIGLCIFGNILTSVPTYDLSRVINEVNNMLDNSGKFTPDGYLAKYTHQIPVAIMIYGIYKLGLFLKISVQNLNTFAIIVNSMFITISAYFTYLSVKKVSNEKNGLLTLIFFVLNPIFYMYSSYYYTDTMCIPFASIGIYLYICSTKNENKKIQILELLLSGLLIAIGCKIRVVAAIVLIAMILVNILQKQKAKQIATKIGFLCIGFIIGIIGFKLITIPFDTITDKKYRVPGTQYLAYGLNKDSDGKFNGIDHDHIQSYNTYEEKVNENIKMIFERIKKLGPSGLLELWSQKLAVTWSNGSYDSLGKYRNVEDVNFSYSYFAGNRRIFFLYILQIFKVTSMILLLFATIYELKNKKENKYDFILIAIFGGFLFYIFWEALMRYSLSFLPWIILTIPVGIKFVEKILNIKEIKLFDNNNKTSKIDFEKCLKYVFIATISTTIILGIANYPKYCLRKNTYYDKIEMQQRDDDQYKIAQNTITQTFTTNKNFDSLSIKFYKNNNKQLTHYNLIIENEKQEEIVKQEFTSDNVNSDEMKIFNFKKIKPNGNEKFAIKIYSNDATENNTLEITSSGLSNYDVYHDGEMYINGQELNKDMMFNVLKKNVRNYVSNGLYIIGFLVIIVIEGYVFYPWIRKEKLKKIEGNVNFE